MIGNVQLIVRVPSVAESGCFLFFVGFGKRKFAKLMENYLEFRRFDNNSLDSIPVFLSFVSKKIK